MADKDRNRKCSELIGQSFFNEKRLSSLWMTKPFFLKIKKEIICCAIQQEYTWILTGER